MGKELSFKTLHVSANIALNGLYMVLYWNWKQQYKTPLYSREAKKAFQLFDREFDFIFL